MDDLTRALASGEAGLGKIEAGMRGDLGQSAQYAAIEELLSQPQPQRPAYRPAARIPWRVQAVAVALAVLVLLIMVAVQ